MKKTIQLLLSVLLLLQGNLTAQNKTFSISVFNNGTALPGSGTLGVWNKNIHPGGQLGYHHIHKKWDNAVLFQNVKLGYYYHRFAQQAIQLYTEAGYQYQFKFGLFADVALGGGYLHAFPDLDVFRIENGAYVKKTNWGRPQAMLSTALSIGYNLQSSFDIPLKPYLQYQFWLQTPYVKEYVPLLPNAAVHLGVYYTF